MNDFFFLCSLLLHFCITLFLSILFHFRIILNRMDHDCRFICLSGYPLFLFTFLSNHIHVGPLNEAISPTAFDHLHFSFLFHLDDSNVIRVCIACFPPSPRHQRLSHAILQPNQAHHDCRWRGCTHNFQLRSHLVCVLCISFLLYNSRSLKGLANQNLVAETHNVEW